MAILKNLIVNGVTRLLGDVYASKFIGDLEGNAKTANSAAEASKATNDGSGNNIVSTYLKLSGGTLTGNLNIAKNKYILYDTNEPTNSHNNYISGGGDSSITLNSTGKGNIHINTWYSLSIGTTFNAEKTTSYFDARTGNWYANSFNGNLNGNLSGNVQGNITGDLNGKINAGRTSVSWIGGKTNAAIVYDSLKGYGGSYEAFYAMGDKDGNVVSFGQIDNRIGFGLYLKDTTENRQDASFYMNTTTGDWMLTNKLHADGGFEGNLDWKYITNKPSILTQNDIKTFCLPLDGSKEMTGNIVFSKPSGAGVKRGFTFNGVTDSASMYYVEPNFKDDGRLRLHISDNDSDPIEFAWTLWRDSGILTDQICHKFTSSEYMISAPSDITTCGIYPNESKTSYLGKSSNPFTDLYATNIHGSIDWTNVKNKPVYNTYDSGLYKITVDGSGNISKAVAMQSSDFTSYGLASSDTVFSALCADDGTLHSASESYNGIIIFSGAGISTEYATHSSGINGIKINNSGVTSINGKTGNVTLTIPDKYTLTLTDIANVWKNNILSIDKGGLILGNSEISSDYLTINNNNFSYGAAVDEEISCLYINDSINSLGSIYGFTASQDILKLHSEVSNSDLTLLDANGDITLTNGSFKSSGGFYQSSDLKLKHFIDDIDVDFEQLSTIPKVYYSYRDDKTDTRHIGTFAQYVLKIYPEIVSKGEDGYYSVDYSKLSIIALAAIDKLYTMISTLKNG